MKKIAIVLFVVASALAGCGKKKPAAAPGGGDMAGSAEPGSAAGSGDAGSAAPGGGSGTM